MPEQISSVSEMPGQLAKDPVTAAQRRARFFNSGNAFNMELPPVPDMAFVEEPARALDPDAPTGIIFCDIADPVSYTHLTLPTSDLV